MLTDVVGATQTEEDVGVQLSEEEDQVEVGESTGVKAEDVTSATLATAVARLAVEEEVEDDVKEDEVLLATLEQRPEASLRRRRFGLTTRTSFMGSGAAMRAARAW